jgi:hypothetical protein
MTTHDDKFHNLDDDGMETYLKQFQPVQAAPLPQRDAVRHSHRLYVPMFLAASFATLLIVGAFVLDHRAAPAWDPEITKELRPAHPPSSLTIGNANLLLQKSLSVREALNSIARDPQNSWPQEGMSSAFTALGKENFKL